MIPYQKNAQKISAGKPQGKRSLGKRKRRCEDNIKTDLTETVHEGVEWIHLAQDRAQFLAL
jgi:hypothetical protein